MPRPGSIFLQLGPLFLLVTSIVLLLQSPILQGLSFLTHYHFHAIHGPINLRSGWFQPGGILSFDTTTGLETKYQLLLDDGLGKYPTVGGIIVECDMIKDIPSGGGGGGRICVNDMTMMSSLLDPSEKENSTPLVQQAPNMIRKQLGGLAGKRILLIGDSVDRNLFDGRINETKGIFTADMPLGSKQILPFRSTLYTSRIVTFPIPSSLRPPHHQSYTFTPRYNTTHTPESDSDRFRVDFVFVFGMDDEKLFNDKYHDGRDVIGTTERISAAAEMWGSKSTDGESGKYDAIIISFGLWDLAGYQRKSYLDKGNDDIPGLSIGWIDNYQHKLLDQIFKIREIHGEETPIFIRLIHNPRPKQSGWFAPPGLAENVTKTDAFPHLRVNQLRLAQRRVAQMGDVGVVPFADMMMGQKDDDFLQDDIHPKGSASLVYWELLLRMASELQR